MQIREASSESGDPRDGWIALLGRRDEPTDGLEDYCTFLGGALQRRAVSLEKVRVQWAELGWANALRQLRRECSRWNGRWVLLQYTALAWSRRAFPFRILGVASVLRDAGARIAVVYHEPTRQSGRHWSSPVRGACQDWVIRKLCQKAERAIFTVPLETVPWLPKGEAKAAFIPIGANIPESLAQRPSPPGEDRGKTVIIFGVTGMPQTDREVDEIAYVMKRTARAIAKVRLVAVGRGAIEAREKLAKALEGANVELTVRGVLPAEEITREFERADALLFVRGAITPQRGSALAGVACGVPIVGYRNGIISEPLKDAGIEWSPWGDRDSLVRGLTRVLSDSRRWMELRERNFEAQENYFAWSKIADRFRTVLAE
ncbi:MAG TPA: glycosyltransferase [Candidatus Acidoferrum sp.]|nr:glycosyltransferase [Candidatus Acidoferrum sp.]